MIVSALVFTSTSTSYQTVFLSSFYSFDLVQILTTHLFSSPISYFSCLPSQLSTQHLSSSHLVFLSLHQMKRSEPLQPAT